MSKSYLPWTPYERFLFPPSPTDWLPEGHLAYFILELVDQLDLRVIEGRYQAKDPRGQRPYAPKMMTALLLYAYCVGEPSSRQIERWTYEDIAFRVIAGGSHPDHKSIAEFRRKHLDELKKLFSQVLKLCQKAGLVKLGHVALDGTKIEANASAHKAMSYERMKASEERLKKEIEGLLERAEAVDAREDEQYGEGGRGDWTLSGELERRETRLARIQKARAELEAEAMAARAREVMERAAEAERKAQEARTGGAAPEKAGPAGQAEESGRAGGESSPGSADGPGGEEEAAQREQERRSRHAQKVRAQAEEAAKRAIEMADKAGQPEPELSPRRPEEWPSHQAPHTAEGVPTDKAQRNFTDPDSRIMKRSGEYIQAYNCQVAVDSAHQIIVEADVTNQAPDPEHLIPMMSKMKANLGALPEKLSSDTGFWSEENQKWCEDNGVDAYIAIGRQKHGEQMPEAAPVREDLSAAEPARPPPKEVMAAKLKTAEGKAVYSRRKAIVEPVFGQIKGSARRLERFLLRGLEKVKAEWALFCLTHNILKMYRAQVG